MKFILSLLAIVVMLFIGYKIYNGILIQNMLMKALEEYESTTHYLPFAPRS